MLFENNIFAGKRHCRGSCLPTPAQELDNSNPAAGGGATRYESAMILPKPKAILIPG